MRIPSPCALPTLLFVLLPLACDGGGSPDDDSAKGGEEAGGDGDGDGDTVDSGDGDVGAGGGGQGDGDAPGAGGIGGQPEGVVPAFVAQGHLGRLVISCDDGHTWVADQANDVGDGTCWSGSNEIECDHNEGAGRGLAFGNGQFFAMFGWGTPSTLRRTSDGVTWEERIGADVNEHYGGVAYLNGTLLAAGRMSRTSADDGLTWADPVDTKMLGWNVRRAGTAGAHFVIVGDADDVVLSADQGASWSAPETLPSGCGAGVQGEGGIAYGDGVILIVGGDGIACASSDGGVTFGQSQVGGAVQSHLVWSGTDFVVYGGGNAFRSPDGVTWSSTAITPGVNLGPIAVGESGTFVGVEGGWGEGSWYAGQEFYRSSDGITWETLPEGRFQGGHPMRTIVFGSVSASELCPPR